MDVRSLSRRRFCAGLTALAGAALLTVSPPPVSAAVAIDSATTSFKLPPIFAVRIHGKLMEPRCPDGSTVFFRTLGPAEKIEAGQMGLILKRNGQMTFRRVAGVDEKCIALLSTNRRFPADFKLIEAGDIAGVAIATGVSVPIKRRKEKSHRKSSFTFSAGKRVNAKGDPRLTLCIEKATAVAADRGWPIRSYPVCYKFIKSIPHPIVILRRQGKDAFTDHAEPYIKRDYSKLESNAMWCGDHHNFDVWVKDGARHVRPWLTAWMDMRSRKIVGYYIGSHAPNTESIIQALRNAILACGIPHAAYVDRGKDYASRALTGETKKERRERLAAREAENPERDGIFSRLGIKPMHAQPYHGQSKPIERFFGTVEESFGKTWPTYCGNKPGNRPENLQDRLERDTAPTLEEFSQAFEGWLATYHGRPHSGDGVDGLTPSQTFDKYLVNKTTTTAELLDKLLLPRTRPVSVRQNGVVYKGLHFGQYAPELNAYFGKKVELAVDGRNLNAGVYVFDADGKFICTATPNQTLPPNATEQELRAAMAEKVKARKAMRESYQTRRIALYEDHTDLMIRGRAAKNAAGRKPEPTPPAPNLVPLRTPLEGELPAIRRAVESRSTLRATGTDGKSMWQRMAEAYEREEREAEERPFEPDPFQKLAEVMSERRGLFTSAEKYPVGYPEEGQTYAVYLDRLLRDGDIDVGKHADLMRRYGDA